MDKSAIALSLLLLLLGSCQRNMEYDVTDGISPEVTLFEKALVLPIGSAGPFTLNLAMKPIGEKLAAFGLPADIISVADDGVLGFRHTSESASDNLYKMAIEIGDNESPYIWKPYSVSASPLLGTILPFIGINLWNQEMELKVSAQLQEQASFTGTVSVVCYDESYSIQYEDAVRHENLMLPPRGQQVSLAVFKVPGASRSSGPSVSVHDIEIILPAHLGNNVYSTGNFAYELSYKANASLGKKFRMALPAIPIQADIPLGKFRLREALVNVELESTVPIRVEIKELKVPDNENLIITAEGSLEGGSPAQPVSSQLALRIKSQDGTPIPDIHSLSVEASVASVPEFEDVILNANQGLSVKNSSITISGGITLFGHEQD